MDKKYLSKRHWLNPKEHADSGAVQYRVDTEFGYINANIDIWDCSRKVALSFDMFDMKEAKQRAHKINLIIKALEEIKTAMGAAWEDVVNDPDEETSFGRSN